MGTWVLYCLLVSTVTISHGARILGICPTPLFSHQQPFQVIMKGLAARGHDITVISPMPLKEHVENYTDIDVSASYKYYWLSYDFASMSDKQPIDVVDNYLKGTNKMIDMQLGSPEIQSFIKSNDTRFDLVVMEKIWYQAYYGLVHHIGSPPVVAFVSLGGVSVMFNSFGNPCNPAVCPSIMIPSTDRMTFWERAYSAYVYLKLSYIKMFKVLPSQEAMMRKYFGDGPPPVYESEYNDTVLLVNNQWSLDYPRALFPNIVELMGLQLQTKHKPLPKDIKEFMDGAEHGLIYFSFGSNVQCSKLPNATLKHIQDAFSEIPQRVLWKWELDSMPGKPNNVMIKKWIPQQDVLAHPNVHAFISQAGLQSVQEAAYHGVPILAIPFLWDQKYNAIKIVSINVGVRLDFKDVTKDTLLDGLRKILNDSSYRHNMKNTFSPFFREHVGSSLDKAIWWIEYVYRHNGTDHLRSGALDLAWYQYILLDVFAVFLLGFLAALAITYFVIKKIISCIIRSCNSKQKIE